MQNISLPFTRDLVLIGGGHTHALVLDRWAMAPLPGARVTVINPGPTAPYSGMLPGYVAGHYSRETLDIDLVRLARRAGARLVIGAAEGLDPQARTVTVPGRAPIAYDVASVDIGITSAMPDLPGFAEHGVPAKPLGRFASAWTRFCEGQGPAHIVLIGGGVAAAELAMAMGHALRQAGRAAEIAIVERDTALSGLGAPAERRLRAALQARGISLLEKTQPRAVHADCLELEDGRTLPAEFVTGVAGARPYPWLAGSGLTDEAGFLPVDACLRTRDPAVFATGDCAAMVESPRPKAGVYAVRQAPVLFHNLRRALSESGRMRPYRPQRDYLKLISLGERSAVAERFGLALAAPALWRLKNRIDRRFMEKFDRPFPDPEPLPQPRAAGAEEAFGGQPICGGCGAKLGAGALRRALEASGMAGAGDDAAVLETGGTRQVISTDHLRALTDDPATMARIAAVHALGDIWAMGAAPQAVLASIVLPRQSPALAERWLREVMQAASETMRAAGAEIVGGHSTQGAEMTIGFTVTGICDGPPITLAGARPGDSLILTKPLGSGVIMAAEMKGKAPGADVAAALGWMTQPQGGAARLLSGATAMTDVTGFGLAGHLRGLCLASGVGAAVRAEAVPLMQGALALAEQGLRSTLYPENRAPFPDTPEGPRHALLFDPQTGGGLLAAVSEDPAPLVDRLREVGFEAACIGEITDKTGQIEMS